jgi:hypothetical protein
VRRTSKGFAVGRTFTRVNGPLAWLSLARAVLRIGQLNIWKIGAFLDARELTEVELDFHYQLAKFQ